MRITSRRPLGAAAAVGALALVGLLASLALRGTKAPREGAEVGHAAPAFELTAVRGGSVSLKRLRGHPLLLSFLNTAARPGADPSRAQIVFLRSMDAQNRRRGLRVVIVDAAQRATGRKATRADLVNYTYDRALPAALPLLPDDGSLARRYGVARVPTTFLIGADGVLERRWDGFAPVAQLDLAIRRLVGRSFAR